jgi:hypothetical protein
MLEIKKLWERDGEKLIDLMWDTAVISTFAFGLIVASMFTIGWAADYNVISIPKHNCHYLIGNWHIDDWCR